MTTDLQARLLEFGPQPCPFDDTSHSQEPDDPCAVCGSLGNFGAEDKCIGNMTHLHKEAAAEIARLTSTAERLEGEPLSYKNAKTVIQMSEQLAKGDALAEAVLNIKDNHRNSPVTFRDTVAVDREAYEKMLAALTDYQAGK